MVICTYFLNNNCRFGSKCVNDHIDLASVIKSEIDVTLKGNQWPLSCFGPFKERNCVPNFIEDFCFEEIRMMFLEAKMQNNIPAHQMQLAQMINDAKQKMQRLATPTREIMNVLIEIYNQQEDSAKLANQPAGNPFAAQIGVSTNSAASIFGGGSTGGFGATGSTFTGTNAASNIFGAAPNQSAANIFGTNTAGSVLGANIFAKPVQPAAGTSNVFGLSALGQQQQSNNVFGAPPVFGGTGSSLFASVGQTQASTGGSVFGGVAPAPGGNLFTQQQSVFGQSAQNHLFTATTQPSQAASPFTATPAPAGTNLFANTTFGTPGSAQPQQNVFAPFGAQPAPFGSPVQQQQTSQSIFLPAPQAAQPVPTVSQSPFGGGQAVFGAAAHQMPTVAICGAPGTASVSQSATLYSRMEDLTKDQLDAFNSERFELGKIPTMPPPRELCS